MSGMRSTLVSKINNSMRRYDDVGPLKKLMVGIMVHFGPGQITCEKYDELMDDHMDGKLSDKERKRFDFHSEICPMCRTHYGEYKTTVSLLRNLSLKENFEVPEALVQAIFRATPGE